MGNDEQQRLRDDARCEAAVQTLKDVLWRFDEMSEGTYTLYDLLGYLLEDLIREGCCAACIDETVSAVYKEVGVDPTVHRQDDEAVYH